ncbi:MAG: DHH family phosphoesterase [Planctomycetota bacterium]
MQAYSQARAALADADSVIVTTHVNPDADGLGSGLALMRALERLGKAVRFVCPSPVAAINAFLPGFERIEICEDEAWARAQPACDVLISCDCGSLDRLERVASLPRAQLINADHHASNTRFGDLNVVDEDAACSGIVVEQLISALGVELDAAMATNLYAAVVFDTGRFMHGNTTAEVLRWTARLLDVGIDAGAINRAISYTKSLHDLQVIRLGLEHLVVDVERPQLAGISLSRDVIDAVGEPEDWGDLIDFPRSLSDNRIAYLLRENRDRKACRVSLRANPPYAVEPVATRFGGGGHRYAAGCTIAMPLEAARAALLPLLRAQL